MPDDPFAAMRQERTAQNELEVQRLRELDEITRYFINQRGRDFVIGSPYPSGRDSEGSPTSAQRGVTIKTDGKWYYTHAAETTTTHVPAYDEPIKNPLSELFNSNGYYSCIRQADLQQAQERLAAMPAKSTTNIEVIVFPPLGVTPCYETRVRVDGVSAADLHDPLMLAKHFLFAWSGQR